MLDSIPAENRPKETHTHTPKSSLTSCVSLERWEKNLKEMVANHFWSFTFPPFMEFTDRGEEKQTFRGQNWKTKKPCQQYIYWLIHQGSYACVLVYVPVGSHVSLNDTTGWRSISDELEPPVPGQNQALEVLPRALLQDFMQKQWDVAFFCRCLFSSFFWKTWITWASESEDERKINKISNLQIF